MPRKLNLPKKMSRFLAPADNLVHETRCYIDAQIDNVKLRSVKGLSQGTSALAGFLLIFIFVGALVMALLFAVVLWLGEVLHSYAQAAFIMAGVLLLVLVVLILLRKHLFKNNFVSMYADVFYQKENNPIGLKSQEGLDIAIHQAESRIKEEEAGISFAFNGMKEFYTPKNLLSESLFSLAARILFGKKKKKKR